MLHNHQAHQHAARALLAKLDAQHHATATHCGNHAGEFRCNFFQASLQIRACFAATAQNILLLDGPDSSYAGSAGQLIAAKGRCMQKRCFNESLPSSLGADDGANGHHAAAQGFRAGHQIRLHAVGVNAKPVAGAANACLHLVGNEQCTLRLTNFLCTGQITGRGHDDTTLALNRL